MSNNNTDTDLRIPSRATLDSNDETPLLRPSSTSDIASANLDAPDTPIRSRAPPVTSMSRRMPHTPFSFTDPNAAAAASFSADLQFPMIATPIAEKSQRSTSISNAGATQMNEYGATREGQDSWPDNEQFIIRNAPGLRSSRIDEGGTQSVLDRLAEPIVAEPSAEDGPSTNPEERNYESEVPDDVCVGSPGLVDIDYDGLADVLSGKAAKSESPDERLWKKYQDEAPAQRFMFFSQQTGALRGPTLESLPFGSKAEPIPEILHSGPFWIDVTEPTFSEMILFSRLFGIHPLTTEDIQTEETREKCEVFMNYYFICIRTFDQNEYNATYMQPINVFIIVFRECILSFHAQRIEHPKNVLQRIEQLRAYGLNITPDWISYALIDDITDAFMPLLRFIELEVDSIDDLVLILKESEQTDMLRRIGHARKKVMQLLRLLSSKAEVLRTVIKRYAERLPADSETSLYLGDIQDHVITMVQNLSHYEKTLARSHSNYLAQISIEITQASNRTNDVVMRMTALASILLPMNLITGLWGMNVWVPGQDVENLSWFIGIVCMLALFAACVWWWGKRQGLV